MDPGVRSHGMNADPPGSLWSKYECFLMSGWWDSHHSSSLNVKLWIPRTGQKYEWTNKRTNEWTNIQTDEQKDENYIPLGINAGGIKTDLESSKQKSFLCTSQSQWNLISYSGLFFFYFLVYRFLRPEFWPFSKKEKKIFLFFSPPPMCIPVKIKKIIIQKSW